MGEVAPSLVPADIFAASWRPTSFHGVAGSWLKLNTPAALATGKGGWTVLEGLYFEGADQVSGAKAFDDQGADVDLASDVNVDGAPGTWRLAIRCPHKTATHVTIKLPYIVDPARGLFCTGAHWVPDRMAQVQLRWLGSSASPKVEIDHERKRAALPANARKILREVDVLTLADAGLRAVASYMGRAERWTNSTFSIGLAAGGPGWWSVRLWGRNCLGDRQIFDASVAVDGVTASFFCRISQEESGLNWSIDFAVYAPNADHCFAVDIAFPHVESEMALDGGLGVCLGGMRLASAVLPSDDGSLRAVVPFAWDSGRLREESGAGSYGCHMLFAPTAAPKTFEVLIRNATIQDYVLAFSGGENLTERARHAAPEGAKFSFCMPGGEDPPGGWRLVTLRRLSADGSSTEVVGIDV